MLGKIEAGREGDDRGWDVWMASLTQWTWVWSSSGRWKRTGEPGMLQSMGSQRVGYDSKSEWQQATDPHYLWVPLLTILQTWQVVLLNVTVSHTPQLFLSLHITNCSCRICPTLWLTFHLFWSSVLSPPLPSLTQSCIPRRSSSFSDFSVSFCTPASCHSPCYLQPSSLSLRNPDDSQGADYYSNLSILETVPSRPELCPSPLVHILTALLKISWNFNHTPIPKGIHVFLLRSVFPCHLHFCNGTTRLPLTWAWHLGSTFGLFSFDGCIYKWPHGCKATGIQLPQCCRQAG